MNKLKILFATYYTILKCSLEIGKSVTAEKLLYLLQNIENEVTFKRVISSYLNTIFLNGTVDESKYKTIELLLSDTGLQTRKYKWVFQHLAINTKFNTYLTRNSLIRIIEIAECVSARARIKTLSRMVDSPFYNTDPNVPLLLLAFCDKRLRNKCPSFPIAVEHVEMLYSKIIMDNSTRVKLILGRHSNILHVHLEKIEKRFLYQLAKYGTTAEIISVMEQRYELRPTLRYYMDVNTKFNPNNKKVLKILFK